MQTINSCPVFVINLGCAPERMNCMDKQLTSIGISYERVLAIKGIDLSSNEINHEYAIELNKKHFKSNLSLGEIGCYISHRNIWRKMVDENIEFAVILEDDLILKNNFIELFSNIEILKNYDLVKLSDNRNYPAIQNKRLNKKFELINFKKIPNCTTGYTLNLNGAKKLLCREKFYRPVDIDMQFCKELDLSVFGIRPYPITENNDFESNIAALNGGNHGNKTTSLLRNIKYRISLWYLRKTHISGAL